MTEEFNVDSKAEYTTYSSTRSQKQKQTKKVPLLAQVQAGSGYTLEQCTGRQKMCYTPCLEKNGPLNMSK